jgi:hypothetical protein
VFREIAMSRELTLEEYVRSLKRKSLYQSLREVYEKVSRGDIKLVDPQPPKTAIEYVFRPDYSLWFWTVLSITISTVVLVYLSEAASPLYPLRYFLGTLYVLLLPGYVIVEALYPRERDLKPLERVALSIGLSLAVVPLVGLVLNYTPWGIRLWPVVISLATLTIGVAIVAVKRKFDALKLSR